MGAYVQEPYRRPYVEHAGDHLCQHPELNRMYPRGTGEGSGLVRVEAVPRVWWRYSFCSGLDWATRRTVTYGLESPTFMRGEGQADCLVAPVTGVRGRQTRHLRNLRARRMPT